MPGMQMQDAIELVLAAGRRLGTRGLIAAAEGNLSVRLDPDRILVTPTGRRKDELKAADLVVVRPEHAEREARSASGLGPTSDLAIHLALYAARPDIEAVAHAHLPSSMALTLAEERPDPQDLPETALFIPRMPFVPFEAMGSDELAARIVAALTESPEPFATVALLERHGAVAVGPDPATTVDRLDLVEVLCRATAEALLLRAARAALR
jgi:L-fuculose-phosphate aldolase